MKKFRKIAERAEGQSIRTTDTWDGQELMTQIRKVKEGGAPIRGERQLQYDDPDAMGVDLLADIRRDKWTYANRTIDVALKARRLKSDALAGAEKVEQNEGGTANE